jgi:hypothetical protein
VPLDYERGLDKVWVYGALCVRDGQVVTQTAPARNTAGYLALLHALDETYPHGDLFLIADNLASHLSGPIRDWLADHPRITHAFIPVGAAWLNLIEGWWMSWAALPPQSLRRPIPGQPRRHRLRHAHRHCPAQSPCQALGVGTPSPTAPLASSLFRVPLLRNDAVESV